MNSPEYSPSTRKQIQKTRKEVSDILGDMITDIEEIAVIRDRIEGRKTMKEVLNALDDMITEIEHGDELEEIERKRKRILDLDFHEVSTPPKKRRVKEIEREHYKELEQLEEERKKREKRRIGKHNRVAYIQNRIQQLEKKENIKDPLVKYHLKEMLNRELANVVGTYNSTVEDTFAIMEAERMLNFRLLEAILRRIFKLNPDTSLEDVTNPNQIKQGLRTLFNLSRMEQAMKGMIQLDEELERQRGWIENWKESKKVILRPPFTALNLSKDTEQFRKKIAKEMGINEKDIFEVKRGDEPLTIGTYAIKDPKENLRIVIVRGFELLKRFYKNLRHLDQNVDEGEVPDLSIQKIIDIKNSLFVDNGGNKIMKLVVNFVNAKRTKAAKNKEYKKVSQVFNAFFIKDFVFRTLRRLYEMEGSRMDTLVDDLNKATKKIDNIKINSVRSVENKIIEIINERTIQTKSVFKRLIGKTNVIVDTNDYLEFEPSKKFELVPDYKQSNQTIEYWKPLTQLTTGAPVNVIKDEIKLTREGGIGIYLKLEYIEDPIYGDTTYFLRKFIDFNDFLMAWYDRYYELQAFTGDLFYKERIQNIYDYFKSELLQTIDDTKLRDYIQIIEDTYFNTIS